MELNEIFDSSSSENNREFLPMESIPLLGCEIEINYMYFQAYVKLRWR